MEQKRRERIRIERKREREKDPTQKFEISRALLLFVTRPTILYAHAMLPVHIETVYSWVAATSSRCVVKR